jgi:hypothetical protein
VSTLAHHVVVGHTEFVAHPEIQHTAATCLRDGCPWCTLLEDAERPCASAVEHATEAGHNVIVRAATWQTTIEATS